MQLVGPGIGMLDTLKNKPIGPDEVFEKFGVGPDRVIDVQALAGDSIDNVPGAPGIGVKTAAQLIQEYGDLDTLLERAGEIRQPKRREVLLGHAEQIRISRDLVTLKRDVPLEEPLAALEVRDPDAGTLLPFLSEMEFRSLAGRVAAKLGVEAPKIEPRAAAEQGPAALAAREPVALPPIDHARYVVIRDAAGARRLDRPDPRTAAPSRSPSRPAPATRCAPRSSASGSASAPARRPTCRSAMSPARAGCSTSRRRASCRAPRRWRCSSPRSRTRRR